MGTHTLLITMSTIGVTGILVALLTPFQEDKQVDYVKLGELVRFIISQGVKGIVVCGTTGEAVTLDDNEYEAVLKHAVTVARLTSSTIHCMAGTGTNNTAVSIKRTKLALELGYDSAMCVCPYYNKPSQRMMVNHFSEIAKSVPNLPICLYNVPGRTSVCLDLASVRELRSICPNVCALKDASTFEHMLEMKALADEDPEFTLFSGEDGLFCKALQEAGFKGCISVTGHIAGKEMQQIYDFAVSKEFTKANELNRTLEPLYAAMFIDTNPTPVKFAVSYLCPTAMDNILRCPLLPVLSETEEVIKKAISSTTLNLKSVS